MFGLNVDIGIETEGTFSGNHSFGFSNMFFLEEELSIKVTNINCIQVNLEIKIINLKIVRKNSIKNSYHMN